MDESYYQFNRVKRLLKANYSTSLCKIYSGRQNWKAKRNADEICLEVRKASC